MSWALSSRQAMMWSVSLAIQQWQANLTLVISSKARRLSRCISPISMLQQRIKYSSRHVLARKISQTRISFVSNRSWLTTVWSRRSNFSAIMLSSVVKVSLVYPTLITGSLSLATWLIILWRESFRLSSLSCHTRQLSSHERHQVSVWTSLSSLLSVAITVSSSLVVPTNSPTSKKILNPSDDTQRLSLPIYQIRMLVMILLPSFEREKFMSWSIMQDMACTVVSMILIVINNSLW